MKNLFKGVLIAAGIILTGSFAQAQSKVGYIDFQQLVTSDPAFKGIQTQIEAYQKQFSDVLVSMQNELQKNANDYESKRATMTDALKAKTETELQDQNKRVQDYNTTATNSVNQKSGELSKPLIDKCKAAVNQVAKEKGYNYVFDSSQTQMVVAPESDDLMAAVKAKLGQTAPAAPTTAAPGKAAVKRP